MSQRLSKTQIQAWATMVRLTQQALADIDQTLSEKGLISLTWYDVLYAIYSAPDRKLRLSDLVEEVILSKSALSRSVDKLEVKGLLTKKPDTSDTRVTWLKVTSAGKESLRKCWPIYRAGIEKHFASKFSEHEATRLLKVASNRKGQNGSKQS